MRTIIEQNLYFKNLIGEQTIDYKKTYKKMQYVLTLECDGIYLALNLLTKQLIEINKTEYEILTSSSVYPLNECIYLFKYWFMVPINLDSKQMYNQFFNLLNCFDSEDYINNYLIVLTTECNANCFYCYEKGIKKISMTEQTSNKTADFIIKNSNNKKVYLHWFGGEPLLNTQAIDIICKKLNDSNIVFESNIITNGYLIDDYLIEKFKEWNIKKVQITLDGTENVYNKTKAYVYKNDTNPFERVLKNISLLNSNKIKTSIRINVGMHNLEDSEKLVLFLLSNFKNSKYITIYLAILYDLLENSSEHNKEKLYKKISELEQQISNNGFSRYKLSNNYKPSCCIADDKHGTTITPDGNLGRCEHFFFNDLWGSLYSENKDFRIIESWKEKFEMYEMCDSCELMPYCIKLKKCPTANFECNNFKKEYRLKNISNAMLFEYKNSLKLI